MAAKPKAKTKKASREAPRDRVTAHLPPEMPPDGGNTPEALADELESLEKRQAALEPAAPPVLTLALASDSMTIAIQGARQLTAQLLGQPESAPLLARVSRWIAELGEIKKLIVGDDDRIEGLKALVLNEGEPWGERGSKEMTLAGTLLRVKAVNFRPMDAPVGIEHLDAGKVEAYIRSNVDPAKTSAEKVLPCYMKATVKWSLTDLTPQQQTNLLRMLSDPGEWGQGLRQCVKDTKYQMMTPEKES